MYPKKILRNLPIFIFATSLIVGCASQNTTTLLANSSSITRRKTTEMTLVIKGKILGFSKKAKTISIKTGKGTQIIKFTNQTKGIEHTQKGHAAIITYKMKGKTKIATLIKPKLAKIPPGTTEIQPGELATLMSMSAELGNYALFDARPSRRFAAGHIENAISIPLIQFKDQAPALLPKDKDKILIFYCGGPT